MHRLFITSSGTAIGKTYVTCQLIKRLLSHNHTVRAIKPLISGWAEPEPSDTHQILDALNLPATADTIDAVSPWRFDAPLSPDMAARLEHKTVDMKQLVDFCHLPTKEEITLIEGVGGVMVPLNEQETVLDWMEALMAPTIVVVGSYLGTLSHSLTALEALKSRNIPIHSIIVNESAESTVDFNETIHSLRMFTPSDIDIIALHRFGTLPVEYKVI